ncbi:hypothetical protein Pan216_30100 [Planctomycetes bacterium Pan216]|uniref:Uncharacterized protein n=1 Tax=Kolteria novifilia TaxID=2527975 RepID=A0A518B581_9BACT|nr:hypothetical protein Pan216_30100 [Planctomycetes bacterium Pan216]
MANVLYLVTRPKALDHLVDGPLPPDTSRKADWAWSTDPHDLRTFAGYATAEAIATRLGATVTLIDAGVYEERCWFAVPESLRLTVETKTTRRRRRPPAHDDGKWIQLLFWADLKKK